MDLTYLRSEVRSIKSSIQNELAIFTAYVAETSSEITTTGIISDLPYSILQGSLITSQISSDNTEVISPLNVGEYDYLGDVSTHNGVYCSSQTSTRTNLKFVYNSELYGTYSRDYHMLCLVVTSDGKAKVTFFPGNILPSITTIVYATASRYGYVTGYSNDAHFYLVVDSNWTSTSIETNLGNYILGNSDIYIANTDPYSDLSDNTTTGGGGGIGTATDTSDTISDPSIPDIDAVSTGFVNLYKPTLAQIQSLGNYMWSSAFDLDSFKKLFANPMDSILGLSIMGVSAPSGGASTVTVGNISTGVSMTELGSQFFKVDCGSLNVQEIWGAYIDYAPYTKCSIYLPFIGTHPLNVDEIMNKTIHLIYTFDALSGACIANLQSGGSVLYSFIGQCSASIPISGNDFTSMINGVITIAGSVGSMVASGGATAPLVLPAMASTAVNSLKPEVEHSGAVSGSGGIMGVKTPYLIFDRPRQAVPKHQNKYIGYPSYITENIGDLSGYTVFEEIKLQGNSHATSGELEEIDNIMKEGVYL